MDKQQYLISRLADGKFHSGELLAAEMGISRAAVCKRVHMLADYGLEVYSVQGKGHRLSHSLDVLDEDMIREMLGKKTLECLNELQVWPALDSTNQHLNQQLQTGSVHGVVVLAEYQRSGKGRRGNQWLSPYASGVCLSLGWHFDETPASYTALSLAVGVAVCRSLQRSGINGVGLKWPNDIVHGGQKLGGILLESRSETAGCSDVVIGIGINVSLPEQALNSISQAATDIKRIGQAPVGRNRLCSVLIEELIELLEQYQVEGFATCIEEWRKYDALKGRHVDLVLPNETLSGKVLGIDENGLLMISINGESRCFSSGELSVRPHP